MRYIVYGVLSVADGREEDEVKQVGGKVPGRNRFYETSCTGLHRDAPAL